MIISISGYAGSGKDSVGKIIQHLMCENTGSVSVEDIIEDKEGAHNWWLEQQSSWEIKKWAGKLKTIASMLTGIPVEKFEDQEFKKTNLGPEWNMTVRDFLQRIGTDGLRTGLHENTWVNALMADYTGVYDIDTDRTTWPNWVITDTRFPNEAEAVNQAGGITIRIERPGVTAVNAHPSETALDLWEFDYTIINDSSLEDLTSKVKEILQTNNLL